MRGVGWLRGVLRVGGLPASSCASFRARRTYSAEVVVAPDRLVLAEVIRAM